MWGCERGGSEEERMDKILLVIGKKGGRERERVKKLEKKLGVGRVWFAKLQNCSNKM